MKAPIGYFVHHQGRGHAERCAALVNALPADRPVTIFCARDDIFPPLRDGVTITRIPSLFEPTGDEAAGFDHIPTPETLHCAPLGWPGIRKAMGTIAAWFSEAAPALMICDVSAEIAQLARICSVPHVMVLQHGDRGDAGHRAAYDGALGVLAPFHADLAQPDWDRQRMFFAPGLGCPATPALPRDQARARLGFGDEQVVLTISGGGGDGFNAAPLGVGARTFHAARWLTAGHIARDWHATEPANLTHLGWVDDIADHIAAADLIVASTGNTTCQQILAAGRPWIAVPEWRYFDEQVFKARALQAAGAALHLPAMPSSAHAWRAAVQAALASHDPARQQALAGTDGAARAAQWIETIIPKTRGAMSASVLTIARGRSEHLRNVLLGLSRQTTPPAEVVIAHMQDDPYTDLPQMPCPVRQIRVAGDALPLAAARNAAAAAATGDLLVFLDVDCIPAPTLVADYLTAAQGFDGLLMGEVMYLPGGANAQGWTTDGFDAVAVRHSDRQGPPAAGVETCNDYRCFWSLNFALPRAMFDSVGGFDERFTGYGGEDTDFGKTLSMAGHAIGWIAGAKVYHQYHPHHMPPVHHLPSVVRNAELFADKWGYRTMEHWLYAFKLMGLIDNDGAQIRILREPDADDIAFTRQDADMPYANTRRILNALRERLGLDIAAGSADPGQKALLRRDTPIAAE